mmetsp:Transcript_44044/g.127373  ORF Transcript_44044/g.127373 Transcript_44044/m.127373 type:complete len:246 (+) Transcript_44044:144-881(+)
MLAKAWPSDLTRKLGHLLKEVTHQAVIGHLEDRRIRVLVDGHDGLRVLHAREVLDGAADAHRHVELRRHDLAGLAHLELVGHETRVHCRTRGAHGRVELVAEGLQHRGEVLTVLEASASRNDPACAVQHRLVADLLRVADPLDARARVGLRRQGLHGGRRGGLAGGLEGGRPEGHHLDLVAALDRGDGVAGVHGPVEDTLLGAHGDDVGDRLHVELRRHPGEGLLAERAGDASDDLVALGLLQGQ